MSNRRWILALLVAFAVSACGGDDASPSASPSTSPSPSPSTSTSPPSSSPEGIPVRDPAAFNAWLKKKEYASWPKESAPHASTGPHAASVLTHLNPKLEASMKAGAVEHPKGSAAVKEFLQNGQVTGWAAYVKTDDTSASGNGWYWYEVFSLDANASTIEGQGKATCTGCHSGGTDFVLSPYPLQ